MKNIIKKSVVIASLVFCSTQLYAFSDGLPAIGIKTTDTNQPIHVSGYTRKMVYQPSQYLLKREQRGHVTIYDGFTDVEVDRVLDKNFDRIQNMMFTRVKMTDPSGEVMVDPETGNEMVSDDGCDD